MLVHSPIIYRHPGNTWGANGCLTSLQTFFHLRVERVLLSLTREFSPVGTSPSFDAMTGMGASIWQSCAVLGRGGQCAVEGLGSTAAAPSTSADGPTNETVPLEIHGWLAQSIHRKLVDALSSIPGVCAPGWLQRRRLATLRKQSRQAWSVRPQPTLDLRRGWTARSRCVPSSGHD